MSQRGCGSFLGFSTQARLLVHADPADRHATGCDRCDDSRSNASQENASQTCSNAKSGATRDAERVRGGHCGFPGSCIGSHSRRVATHLIALRDSYLIFLILTALGNAAMAALGGRLGCTEFSFSACQELTCRLPTCRAQPALGPRALCVLALRLSS